MLEMRYSTPSRVMMPRSTFLMNSITAMWSMLMFVGFTQRSYPTVLVVIHTKVPLVTLCCRIIFWGYDLEMQRPSSTLSMRAL